MAYLMLSYRNQRFQSLGGNVTVNQGLNDHTQRNHYHEKFIHNNHQDTNSHEHDENNITKSDTRQQSPTMNDHILLIQFFILNILHVTVSYNIILLLLLILLRPRPHNL